jgi:hypothetical protein
MLAVIEMGCHNNIRELVVQQDFEIVGAEELEDAES